MGTAIRLAAVFWIYGFVALAPASAQAGVLATSVADTPDRAKPARVRIHGRVRSSLNLQSSSGSTVEPSVRDAGADTDVDVPIGKQVTAKAGAEAPVALSRGSKQPISGAVFVGTLNTRTGGVTAWRFQPVVQAKIVPLQWDPAAKGYLTTIEVGLDSDQSDARLIGPVTFDIRGENVERVDPDRIQISVPGPAGYIAAKILTTHYVPSVKISVHSPAGDAAFVAGVDPGLAMALTATQSTIPAFGLGTTVITLSCRKADGSDGSALASCAGHHIPTTTFGRLEPTSIELKAGAGPPQITLYSASSGTTTVTVDGLPGLQIEMVWPWSLFFAGLAGAFIGAGLRMLGNRRKAWRRVLIGSVVTGVIIDILLTLGVPLIHDLQAGIMTTEGGWFGIGALGGLLGTHSLVRIAQKLFGISDHDEPAPADSNAGKGAGATKVGDS